MKKDNDGIQGVWRTISGRRVFIKDGQDLATAMKESGKFNNLKTKKGVKEVKYVGQDNKIHKMNSYEYPKNRDEYHDFLKREYGTYKEEEINVDAIKLRNDFYEYEEYAKKIKKVTESPTYKEKMDKAVKELNEKEKSAKMNEVGERLTQNALNGARDDTYEYLNGKVQYDGTKEDFINDLSNEWGIDKKQAEKIVNKQIEEVYTVNFGDSSQNYEDTKNVPFSAKEKAVFEYREQEIKRNKDFHYAGEELYSDDPNRFGDKMRKYNEKMNPTKNEASKQYSKEKYGDQFVEGANRENKFKTGDKVIYNGNEVEIYQTHKDPRYGNEYLVRGDEGNVWVTDNSLEKISTGNDYLPKEKKVETAGTSNRKEVSDNIQAHILDYYDNPVDFMEQMDAMDWLPTRWHAGQKLAEGGSYLIYNGDMADFLDSLNINPKGKKFSEDKSFQMYTSLIGRESERLYNRLEKLFDQYKKEHKNSNATLDDFRKWFK